MANRKLVVLIASSFALTGCVLHAHEAMPVASVPARHLMTYNEAVDRGQSECRARGYECQLQEAHETGNGVWKVKLETFTRHGKGHLHLEYASASRELLRVDDKFHDRAERDDGYGGRELLAHNHDD